MNTETETVNEEKNAAEKAKLWLHVLCICMAAVFLFAAVAKLANVYAFTAHLRDQLAVEGLLSIDRMNPRTN